MAYRSPLIITGRRHSSTRRSEGTSAKVILMYLALGLLVLLLGVYLGLATTEPMTAGTVAGFLILIPILWSRPALGAYLIVGGAVVFEVFPLGFPDSITDHAIFFRSLEGAGAPSFMIATGAEVLMGFSLVIIAVRRMTTGKRPLDFGPLFVAVAFYTIMVGYGLIYGIGTGGNYINALWEARAQIYFFLVYLMVYNTIHEKKQLKRLMWVAVIGISIKGMIGLWRYLITLEGDLSIITKLSKTSNSILSHEESFFFALFFLFGLVLFLFRGNRAQFRYILIAAIPVFITLIANERRAGILAMFVGAAVVTFLAFYLLKSRRKLILWGIVALIPIMPIYMAATWNVDGPIAQPTRAVKSLIAPDDRDVGSNEYRQIESEDVKINIQLDPLRGRGFGKPIIWFVPLPDISTLFYFWDLIPHNTILWVWMRMGFFGFVAFWFMVGRGLTASMIVSKQVKDPYIKSIAVFTIAALVAWIFMGLVDMGLTDFRETILVGALFGMISRLPDMDKDEFQRARVKSEQASTA